MAIVIWRLVWGLCNWSMCDELRTESNWCFEEIKTVSGNSEAYWYYFLKIVCMCTGVCKIN